MENDDAEKNDSKTPADLPPGSVKEQTRKERSKANPTTKKPGKDEKHSLWRNWKSLSRTKQLELLLLGAVAMGGVGYLIAYLCQCVANSPS
jgi:hypothetical protein